jgi:hypothetical protein
LITYVEGYEFQSAEPVEFLANLERPNAAYSSHRVMKNG